MTPRITDTAKALLAIYLALSSTEILALLLAGMPLYDAVVHTFTTVATGGFSPKTASIGFYDSVAIEAVLIAFMTLSGVSFSLYYLLYNPAPLRHHSRQGVSGLHHAYSSGDFFVWGILVFEGDYGDSALRALRDSAFTVTSIVSTTGFVTADFDGWDAGAKITLVMLMFVGGCAGPTAGGI